MLTEDRMLAARYITVFLLLNSETGHRCWYFLLRECQQHDISQRCVLLYGTRSIVQSPPVLLTTVKIQNLGTGCTVYHSIYVFVKWNKTPSLISTKDRALVTRLIKVNVTQYIVLDAQKKIEHQWHGLQCFCYRTQSRIPTIDRILVHDLLKYVCYKTSLLMLKNGRTLVLLFMTEFLLQEDVVDIQKCSALLLNIAMVLVDI